MIVKQLVMIVLTKEVIVHGLAQAARRSPILKHQPDGSIAMKDVLIL